jgi:hypothetical protein
MILSESDGLRDGKLTDPEELSLVVDDGIGVLSVTTIVTSKKNFAKI